MKDKVINKKIFRLLILMSLGCILLSAGLTWNAAETLPWEIQKYLVEVDNEGISVFEGVYAVVLLFIFIVATVGIWLVKGWGRILFSIQLVLWLFSSMFFGIVILTPLEVMLNDLSLMINGVILAMMYTEPLRQEFNTNAH